VTHEPGGHGAAWYQDPEKPKGLRYWDGQRWTGGRARVVAFPVAQRRSHGALYAFIVLAVVLTACLLVITA
jgi:hypothetical protein